jgi:CubicO group peptidase (beta-lactamase class C family)
MQINRRWALGLGAAASVALASAGRAATVGVARVNVLAPGEGDAGALLKALGDYAAAEMNAWGLPGMTLSVRGPKGLRAVMTLGLSDIERGLPVRPDQLFQIGSISKSLVALCLYRLAAQGRLDLDAPMATVLPGVPLPVPVTVQQLLEHSSGLAHDAPLFPRVNGNMLWTGFTPGTRFSYSNTGYDLLGHVVSQVTGKTYAAACRELVLVPLGMTHAEPVIVARDRARYAIGYVPVLGDRVYFPDADWAAGPWFDADIPAGSVAATPADMLRYLDMLAQLSAGKGGALMTDALARRFVTATVDAPDFGKGARYNAGLATIDIDDHKCLHHTGGMISFSSSMMFDAVADGGVFASSNVGNINYRPREITRYGCRLLRAYAEGKPLPEAPAIRTQSPVEDPANYIGSYRAANGSDIEIVPYFDGIAVRVGSVYGSMKPIGATNFLTDHPALYAHEIAFDAGTTARDRLWWGGTLYGRDAPLATPPVPAKLAARAGSYYSSDSWVGGTSIVARGDTLVVEGVGPISENADGSWRFADPDMAVERVWFDAPLAGKMQRASLSGADMWRFNDG